MASKIVRNRSHGKGPTCLAFSPDGDAVLTGGCDCLVAIWDLNQGSAAEPIYADDAEKDVSALASSEGFWMAASNDSAVRRYANVSSDLTSVVASAKGLPIRSISLDSSHRLLAVASDDLDVQVVSISDDENIQEPRILKGHKGGVRKVSWHPRLPILISSSCDGSIIIWDLSEAEPTLLKTIPGIISRTDETSDDFHYDCSALWHPSGDQFFILASNNEIAAISKPAYQKTATFSDDSIRSPVTAAALSPNGEYLVGACSSKLVVWMLRTHQVIARHETSESTGIIHQVAFSPRKNLICWTDGDGAVNRLEGVIPSNLPGPTAEPSSFDAILAAAVEKQSEPPESDPLGIDDEMEDSGSGIPDEADWIIDDVQHDDEDGTDSVRGGPVKEMVSITKAQPAFQPGATPMNITKKRYLAYNMLGVIEVTDQDTYQIVNVEFFDRSLRSSFHFNDAFACDMGYLGQRGALFACPSDKDQPAQIFYKPYESLGPRKEWTYQLGRPDLRILGLTVGASTPSPDVIDIEGDGTIVVATNDGALTFLSGTGYERRIMGLGADFVSMVATQEWVFIVWRAGSTTIDGSQNLSYSLINFEDFTIRQRDILPVSKGHTLKWIGITQEGAPAMYDSAGYLHVLTKFRIPHHASWARILDTQTLDRKRGKDESYWPIGVSKDQFMCLILKGRQEYPGFPRPLIQELPIRLPFRAGNSEDSEKIERQMLLLDFERDALGLDLTSQEIVQSERDLDKEFIKLIQTSCKQNDTARAFELAKLLHNIASIPLAIKVADFYRLSGLKQRLEALKDVREQETDRLEAAREKRLQWTLPQPGPRRILDGSSSSSYASNPFQDFTTAPTNSRPGLGRAKPVVEHTKYSSEAAWEASKANSVAPPFAASPIPASAVATSPNGEGKRKRDESQEESQETDILSASFQPPAKKANPFAKKADGDSNRNPFARKTNNTSRQIEKSDSFFNKVDQAEQEDSMKSKEKKSLPAKDRTSVGRQTTLLGMLPAKSKDRGGESHTSSKTQQTDDSADSSSAFETQDAMELIETQ